MKVLIFLSQGYEDSEAAAFIDVLGWTRVTEGVTPVYTDVVGLDKEVVSAMGLRVLLPKLLSEVDPAEYVAMAIPGGFHDCGFRQAYHPEVLDVIREIHRQGGIIATICVGALPVARAGLLRGKRASTYPCDGGKHLRVLEEEGAIITGAWVEEDGRVITSQGPATGFSVAFKLVEMLSGAGQAKRLQEEMRFLWW